MPQNSPELAGCQLGCLGSAGPGCSGVSSAAGIPGSQRHSRLSELEGPAETSPRPLLTDRETEAQRAEEASPRSRSRSVADAGFKPHFPGSQFGWVLFSGPRMASPLPAVCITLAGSALRARGRWGGDGAEAASASRLGCSPASRHWHGPWHRARASNT